MKIDRDIILTPTDITVYSGTNFTAFSTKEWYEEHKDELEQYGQPPEEYIPNYNVQLERSSWKYSSGNESSGTDILL